MVRRGARLALAVGMLGGLVAACSDATSILVEVSSADLAAPDDVDMLRFRARSDSGALADESFELTGSWPHSLSIRPREGDDGGHVTIEVVALRDGALVVRRVVEADFVPDETRLVRVELTRECVAVECGDYVDCRAGMCVGGGPRDAGMPDSGRDAGLDARVEEAGRDAAMDGGADAGRDAGSADLGSSDAGDARAGDAGDARAGDGGAPETGPFDAGADSGADGGIRRVRVVINEVDYDQPSVDTMEFVELLNTGDDEVSLGGLELVLVNGSGGTPYATIPLSGELSPAERAVVRMPAVVVPAGIATIDMPAGVSIQNGDPDGLALWDPATGTLIDALSYGGAITNAMLGPATTVSLVEGTMTPLRDSATAVRSLVRIPDGTDTDDASHDWASTTMPSPGAPNVAP